MTMAAAECAERLERSWDDNNKEMQTLIVDPSGIIIGQVAYRCALCRQICESVSEATLHYQVDHIQVALNTLRQNSASSFPSGGDSGGAPASSAANSFSRRPGTSAGGPVRPTQARPSASGTGTNQPRSLQQASSQRIQQNYRSRQRNRQREQRERERERIMREKLQAVQQRAAALAGAASSITTSSAEIDGRKTLTPITASASAVNNRRTNSNLATYSRFSPAQNLNRSSMNSSLTPGASTQNPSPNLTTSVQNKSSSMSSTATTLSVRPNRDPNGPRTRSTGTISTSQDSNNNQSDGQDNGHHDKKSVATMSNSKSTASICGSETSVASDTTTNNSSQSSNNTNRIKNKKKYRLSTLDSPSIATRRASRFIKTRSSSRSSSASDNPTINPQKHDDVKQEKQPQTPKSSQPSATTLVTPATSEVSETPASTRSLRTLKRRRAVQS